jgi:chromosome partitioning protein
MRVLTVLHEKGGVGKTTTAVSLSAILGSRGRRVLLVDLDPQATATRWVGPPGLDPGASPYHVLEGSLPVPEAIVHTPWLGLDLLPASGFLTAAATALAAEPGSDRLLATALAPLEGSGYDLVVIDGPPSMSFLAHNALCASSEVVIPIEARFLAAEALVGVVGTVEKVRRRLNPKLQLAALVVSRLDRRTRHAPEVAARIVSFAASELPGVPVLTVRENVKLSEAAAARQPIHVYAPTSAGAEDYAALAETLLVRRAS